MSRTPVCRDFLRGSCRFGSRCKFSHVTSQQQRQQSSSPFGFGIKNQVQQQPKGRNYYSPLASQGQEKNQSQGATKEHRCVDPKECKEQVKEDFKNELPVFWKLTCYAHGKYLPNDLVGDVSFEELRAYAYAAGKQGMSFDSVVQNERSMFAAKKREFESLLNNPYSGPASTGSSGSFRDTPLHEETSRMSFGTGTKVSSSSPFWTPNTFAGSMGSGFSFGLGAENAVTAPNSILLPQSPPAVGFSFGMQPSANHKPATQLFSRQNPFSISSQPLLGFGQTLSNLTPRSTNSSPSSHNVLAGSNIFQMANEAEMSDSLPSPNLLSIRLQDSRSPTIPEPSNHISLSPTNPAAASPQKHEGPSNDKADIWLKESWDLGEIPEEEPPVYAR